MFHAQAVGMKLYRKGPAWRPEHERSHVTVIAAVERDIGPHIDLLGSRVSHSATLEEMDSLTFSSSSLATVLEIARTQRSPAVNAGMSAPPEPVSSIRSEPPPHGTPPQEVADSP